MYGSTSSSCLPCPLGQIPPHLSVFFPVHLSLLLPAGLGPEVEMVLVQVLGERGRGPGVAQGQGPVIGPGVVGQGLLRALRV